MTPTVFLLHRGLLTLLAFTCVTLFAISLATPSWVQNPGLGESRGLWVQCCPQRSNLKESSASANGEGLTQPSGPPSSGNGIFSLSGLPVFQPPPSMGFRENEAARVAAGLRETGKATSVGVTTGGGSFTSFCFTLDSPTLATSNVSRVCTYPSSASATPYRPVTASIPPRRPAEVAALVLVSIATGCGMFGLMINMAVCCRQTGISCFGSRFAVSFEWLLHIISATFFIQVCCGSITMYLYLFERGEVYSLPPDVQSQKGAYPEWDELGPSFLLCTSAWPLAFVAMVCSLRWTPSDHRHAWPTGIDAIVPQPKRNERSHLHHGYEAVGRGGGGIMAGQNFGSRGGNRWSSRSEEEPRVVDGDW